MYSELIRELTRKNVNTENIGSKLFYVCVKRVFDFVCSLIGCLLLIPVALIVKVVYVLTGDYSSIFLIQKRIGKDGKEFNFYKFRTMVVGADKVLADLLEKDPVFRVEFEKNKKVKNDPRITKVGRILRKTSLDELPQMINVFLGDMSMIGNRPYMPREKEDMGVYFSEIVKTTPGITGYWQVERNSVDSSFETRLRMEKYYSQNCSLMQDIKIFFKTFQIVLKNK